MSQLPPIKMVKYNKVKNGYFGQLGEGANAHIKFLQTGITSDELDSITLIENIPGSEQWDVRDLFQRDVDKDRVTNSILPYLKDGTKVKYFNPLTLMVLPLQDNAHSVERTLKYIEPTEVTEDGHRYSVYELQGYFRFAEHLQNPAYSNLSWSDQAVRLVAIDGQHRLSALKRLKNEPESARVDLQNWRIPVIILGIFKAHQDKDAATLLEIVRKTFVYINTEAREVNEARKILLNDESVNAICAQELVRLAHENDCLPEEKRNAARLPLMFFDWRGETQNNQRVVAPAAITMIEEVEGWLEYFLLGEDGSDAQSTALALEDMVPPLSTFGPEKRLSHHDAQRVRDQAQKSFLPGLSYLLENFAPYKKYVAECRAMERQQRQDSDLAQHAFTKLRFGSCRASEELLALVQEKYDDLIGEFDALKQKFLDELLARDIGMRAVMCAYGYGKEALDEAKSAGSTWLDYAKWYTDALNKVYADGWFKSFDKLDKQKQKLLTHVAYDASGSIINYKFDQQRAALGSMMQILVFVRAKAPQAALEAVWTECGEQLSTPLRSGYRKYYRGQMAPTFTGGLDAFKAEVNKKATKATEGHLRDLGKYLGLGDS
ncbi:MAG: hypothetical protein HS104_26980 [Polyangiaceae bacterium]|nr:hypothetical protein [Polyangiaceae bacterium]